MIDARAPLGWSTSTARGPRLPSSSVIASLPRIARLKLWTGDGFHHAKVPSSLVRVDQLGDHHAIVPFRHDFPD